MENSSYRITIVASIQFSHNQNMQRNQQYDGTLDPEQNYQGYLHGLIHWHDTALTPERTYPTYTV